jgi:hypothetical protein
VCGTEKPATEFSPYASVATCNDDWAEAQAERKRQHMRDQRAEKTPEEKAAGQAAWRAGIRKDKCAVCASVIEGQGLCLDCRDLVDALGGLDGIKRAVKAVRWLESQA